MQKPDKKGSPRVWVRVVLVVSLALNLAVLGVVVGAVARFGAPGDGPPARADLVGGAYTRALSPADRRKIGRQLMRDQNDALPTRSTRAGEYQNMLAALRAQPFDADTVNAILQRQRDFGHKRAELGHKLFLQHLSDMSAADRSAYADRLEQGLNRHDGDKKRPPSGHIRGFRLLAD
ncbi:periplasmic heavy metal sensor [Thalassovita gelatinovora]|nr:periplasmic heavy metal sensor [Thalassovita gelatinovora]